MSFTPETPKTPTAVKALNLSLRVSDKNPGPGRDYSATYDFHVLDASGRSMSNRTGDLIPVLTTAQRTALQSFVDSMLDKAKATIP